MHTTRTIATDRGPRYTMTILSMLTLRVRIIRHVSRVLRYAITATAFALSVYILIVVGILQGTH